MAQRNRTVLLAALAQRLGPGAQAGAGEPDVLGRVAATLRGLSGVSDLDRYTDVDAPAALAAGLGMVLGVALLDDLLFTEEMRRPGRDRLIAEMEKLLLFGVTKRDGSNRH
jgi:hypothetical protein